MQVAQVRADALGAGGILTPESAVIAGTGDTYVVARLLRQQWLHSALSQWQLNRYDMVRFLLVDVNALLEVRDLWIKVFGDDLPNPDEDLEGAFLHRIHEERFPLALQVYDDYLYSMDNHDDYVMLAAGLRFESYGIAWEMETIDDIAPPLQPVAACVMPFWVAIHYGREHDDYGKLRAWWTRWGYPEPPVVNWCDGEVWNVIFVQGAIEYLDALEPPLDGLGAVLRMFVRENDNPFLDFVHPYWQGEYDQWDYWDWSAETVKHLTQVWQETEPMVEIGRQYVKWFEETPNATERVIEILLGLDEELGLTEEDDDDR